MVFTVLMTAQPNRASSGRASIPVHLFPAVIIAALFLLFPAAEVIADIYLYKDENGVFHFTDQPSTPEYRLFIKQWRTPKPSESPSSSYDPYIDEASRLYGIDTALLKAVVKVESNFNPRAVSHKGALGLMQIMPQNVAVLDIQDPFDPRQNILGGARYLKEMLNRYGDLNLALAAYNAGPAAVDRYKEVPPFTETRSYVQQVLHNYDTLKKR